MSRSRDVEIKIDAFVTRMKAELDANRVEGMRPPVERRRQSTVTDACGSARMTESLRSKLQSALDREGVFVDPPLDDIGLKSDSWLRFSTMPFPPDVMIFPDEESLQGFVASCIGTGPFRNLEIYKEHGKAVGQQYHLPNGNRVDILCRERLHRGYGSFVVIELKRDHERGTVEQLIDYMEALKSQFPGHDVRGIIVSGREDRILSAELAHAKHHNIEWYCYHVVFEDETKE